MVERLAARHIHLQGVAAAGIMIMRNCILLTPLSARWALVVMHQRGAHRSSLRHWHGSQWISARVVGGCWMGDFGLYAILVDGIR